MTAQYWTHTVQILLMLGAAFALGLWLGYLLWHKWRRQYEELRAANGKLQSEHARLLSESSTLRTRLADCEQSRIGAAAEAKPVTPDDLKLIEGIGPKIEKLCNAIGIFTWRQLAQTSVERLEKMLSDAGPEFRVAVPQTWPRQAELAAERRWDELKKYQDFLQGGREPDRR